MENILKEAAQTAAKCAEDNKSGSEIQSSLEDIIKKLFGNSQNISDVEFNLICECAGMLEGYVYRFPDEKGCAEFDFSGDMRKWKEEYYPKLVQNGPLLLDDRFFTMNNAYSNLGIGNDGVFTGYEFFQFMYRVYKAITEFRLKHKLLNEGYEKVITLANLLSCALMLEKYVDLFPKETATQFNSQDMKMWLEAFYPNLVQQSPKLPDNEFFNAASPSAGIGTDGIFNGYELFQFLYRLYKEIAVKLS